jgi:hypothetical protein
LLFAVVGCPACRRVQVIETRTPNVRCRGCDKQFDWSERKRFYHGDDAKEARRVASTLSLQVGGAGIEAIAESAAAMEREKTVSVEQVVRQLELLSEFGMEDVESVCKAMRFNGPADRLVAMLRSQQRVFEPRPGRFRWIP